MGTWLSGKKTYLTALATVAWVLLDSYLHGVPINFEMISTAVMAATIRNGIANSASKPPNTMWQGAGGTIGGLGQNPPAPK